MILGFYPHFQTKIETGTKIHTIREDKTNRWKKGNIIHFATGVRTKSYNCFKIGKCVSIQEIEIKYFEGYKYPRICIYTTTETSIKNGWGLFPFYFFYDDDDWRGEQEKKHHKVLLDLLAKNDGFDTFDDFCKWFNADFEGKIIHWTDFSY